MSSIRPFNVCVPLPLTHENYFLPLAAFRPLIPQGRHEVARLLAARGVPVDEPHARDGYSPFHRAAWGTLPRHTETIATLVELGADPTRPGANDGKTPLFMAQERGTNADTIKLLRRLTKEVTRELKRRASAEAHPSAEPRLVAAASNVRANIARSRARLTNSPLNTCCCHVILYLGMYRHTQVTSRTSCEHVPWARD